MINWQFWYYDKYWIHHTCFQLLNVQILFPLGTFYGVNLTHFGFQQVVMDILLGLLCIVNSKTRLKSFVFPLEWIYNVFSSCSSYTRPLLCACFCNTMKWVNATNMASCSNTFSSYDTLSFNGSVFKTTKQGWIPRGKGEKVITPSQTD